MKAFLSLCVRALSRRNLLFVAMNTLYFGSILVAALFTQAGCLPLYKWAMGENIFLTEVGDLPRMIATVFLFNLFLNAFVLVTLSGLAFFALPATVLVWRAALWGVLLNLLPTHQFLAVLPTFVLEGEGYVLASVAGIILEASWLKPNWIFKGETLSRWKALKKALGECLRIYVLVAMILFVAAVVETFTILSLTT